jgi:cysteinyl-tRNA synthetase
VYVCGVTVYDRCHVGHARAFVVFDVLHRYLRASGYEVAFVRNITDVDDKIIQRARDEGIGWREVAERYLAEFQRDVAALGCLPPTSEPRATDYVPQMLELIERLVDKGLAYPIDGDVYYAVERFPGYGKLSKRRLEEMLAGARVEVDERKRHPADFALWKAVPPERERQGEPAWPSRWGRGRPGWHIECSAMSTTLLGQPFDIHGGGEDLVFPHHENEIAQSEGAFERPLARYFVHNSFVRWKEEKMSKSLGNVFGIREVTQRLPAEALRLFLISTHYRSPMDFSIEGVEESLRALVRLYETKARIRRATGGRVAPPLGLAAPSARLRPFVSALDDDLNTARAVAVVFDLVREANRSLDAGDTASAEAIGADLAVAATVLGVGSRDPEEFLEEERTRALDRAGLARDDLERRIAERAEFRRSRDWARADAIRRELLERGIALEDTPQGTAWRPLAWGVEARGPSTEGRR